MNETVKQILWSLCHNGADNYQPAVSISGRKNHLKAALALQNSGIAKILRIKKAGYHEHDMVFLQRDVRRALESGDYVERYINDRLEILDA